MAASTGVANVTALERLELLLIAMGIVMVGQLVRLRGPSLFAKMADTAAESSGYGTDRNPFTPLVKFGRVMLPAYGLLATVAGIMLAAVDLLGFWGVGPFR
jgi:hypothetical protein